MYQHSFDVLDDRHREYVWMNLNSMPLNSWDSIPFKKKQAQKSVLALIFYCL